MYNMFVPFYGPDLLYINTVQTVFKKVIPVTIFKNTINSYFDIDEQHRFIMFMQKTHARTYPRIPSPPLSLATYLSANFMHLCISKHTYKCIYTSRAAMTIKP